MRAWNKSKQKTELQKKKDIARSYALVYLKNGKLKRQCCEVCGSDRAEMHHEDYDKPLEVRWLCKEHHHELHRSEENRRGNLQFVVAVPS